MNNIITPTNDTPLFLHGGVAIDTPAPGVELQSRFVSVAIGYAPPEVQKKHGPWLPNLPIARFLLNGLIALAVAIGLCGCGDSQYMIAYEAQTAPGTIMHGNYYITCDKLTKEVIIESLMPLLSNRAINSNSVVVLGITKLD